MPQEKGTAKVQKRKAPPVQGREYSKRPRRAPVSYADPEDSDDSAFYETDTDGEGVATRKVQPPKQARPLPKRKIFPFLSLPRELRDIIYDYALGRPTTLTTTIVSVDKPDPSDPSPPPRATVTTAASNIIRLRESKVGFRRGAARMSHRKSCVLQADGVTRLPYNAGEAGTLRRSRASEPAPLATGLLGACRQLRAEAAPVLYGGRTRFEFVDSAALLLFVGRLSRETRGLLRDVKLMQWWDQGSLCKAYDNAVFELLAEGVTGLRAFRYDEGSYSARKAWWEVKRICRLGWRWLEAMAREKEDGFDGVLKVLLAGIENWGDDWKAGEENWTLFEKEFRALMEIE
ncbi:hypothetical protein SLS58_007922 [Diplodia intermedia]|uniref:Uncharacterized protein n=1 Tax=Diplodia intermedia TaxID=856260 RepID=A0ABR3TJD3_9PEZI